MVLTVKDCVYICTVCAQIFPERKFANSQISTHLQKQKHINSHTCIAVTHLDQSNHYGI